MIDARACLNAAYRSFSGEPSSLPPPPKPRVLRFRTFRGDARLPLVVHNLFSCLTRSGGGGGTATTCDGGGDGDGAGDDGGGGVRKDDDGGLVCSRVHKRVFWQSRRVSTIGAALVRVCTICVGARARVPTKGARAKCGFERAKMSCALV